MIPDASNDNVMFIDEAADVVLDFPFKDFGKDYLNRQSIFLNYLVIFFNVKTF